MLHSAAEFVRTLLKWYDANRRDMPWRVPIGVRDAFPDPYHVLVSEAMLQQTQVATATAYFLRFTTELPRLTDLAAADEQTVLKLWQGLGYYARARNLRKTAQAIVDRHGGQIPSDVDALLSLPGIGPYTAGAIASLAFGRQTPLVDGNVARVLCRLDLITDDPRTPVVNRKLWARAGELVPADRPGDFNSAMMELGATVCQPRNPACLLCPVQRFCAARDAGRQAEIPPPKQAKPSPVEKRWTFCISHRQRWLMEQRPASGRWASMWQFITVQTPPRATKPTAKHVKALLHLMVDRVEPLLTLAHVLSHRKYQFAAFHGSTDAAGSQDAHQKWLTLAQIRRLPLPRPQVKILEALEAVTSRA